MSGQMIFIHCDKWGLVKYNYGPIGPLKEPIGPF